MPTARVWLISFAGSWALWLVLAGSVARSEVVAGAAVAASAAAIAVVVLRGRANGRVPAAPLRRLGAALLAVPVDMAGLAIALLGAAAGKPASGRFEEIRVEDGHGRAFRAAVESLSPGAYVVDDEHAAGTMLVHRLGGRG